MKDVTPATRDTKSEWTLEGYGWIDTQNLETYRDLYRYHNGIYIYLHHQDTHLYIKVQMYT